ncbi:MAG: efflux RND transporter periplasmic adaptor subunit [candidate division Zixibacteria bacterium]|nr:efflux RND transporter periplasmic adaptor subunit [candidate division Zixibacteria bacterium]
MRLACFSVPIGIVLLTALGCGGKTGDEAAVAKAVVPVKVTTIRQGDLPLRLVVLGQTEALDKQVVLSPVSGTVASLSVSEGAAVSAGEVLAVIQTRESQTAVAGAQALRATATTSQQRAEAERALQLAQTRIQTVTLTAHRGGVVARRSVVEGSQVSDGTELLAIVDPATTGFVAQVPLARLPTLSVGQPATVTLASLDGVTFRAAVAAISPESEPQTQAVRVRLALVDVPPEHRRLLKDGLSGTAQIETGRHSGVLLVPRVALLRNDESDTYAIVTVTPDSLAQSVPVTVGAVADSVAEIAAPTLHPGMSVIIEGQYALADSTRVTVTSVPRP